MGKNMIILPYELGQGFPTVDRLTKLNGPKKHIKNAVDIIKTEINEKEIKHNKMPWYYWTGLAGTFVLIIAGIALIKYAPVNYILISLGVIGFIVFGIFFFKKFSKKMTFADEGLKLLDSKCLKHMTIIKVYENLDNKGLNKKITQLRFQCFDEYKSDKKKKKSGQKTETQPLLAGKENLQESFDSGIYVQQASHKKSKLFMDEENYNQSRNQDDSQSFAKKKKTSILKNINYDDSYDDHQNMPHNNLRTDNIQSSELIAPREEDFVEERSSIELDYDNDNGPRDFYNPQTENEIENYDHISAQKEQLQYNPYGKSPVYNPQPSIENFKNDDIITYELDVNDIKKGNIKRNSKY